MGREFGAGGVDEAVKEWSGERKRRGKREKMRSRGPAGYKANERERGGSAKGEHSIHTEKRKGVQTRRGRVALGSQ